MSELNKKNALEFYASHRITLSLPFKKYVKNMYLRSTLGAAYEEYARKHHAHMGIGCFHNLQFIGVLRGRSE